MASGRLMGETQQVFLAPDRDLKELAGSDPNLGLGTFRTLPGYTETKFNMPCGLPVELPKVMDRCIPAWPDPNTASIRPYMKECLGSYNNRRSWGIPYKAARGMHMPPQTTEQVYVLSSDAAAAASAKSKK